MSSCNLNNYLELSSNNLFFLQMIALLQDTLPSEIAGIFVDRCDNWHNQVSFLRIWKCSTPDDPMRRIQGLHSSLSYPILSEIFVIYLPRNPRVW